MAPEYPHTTVPLSIFPRIASLESFYGYQLGEGDEVFEVELNPGIVELMPQCNNLASIFLRPYCHLHPEHMTRLCGSAKALETFDYNHGHFA